MASSSAGWANSAARRVRHPGGVPPCVRTYRQFLRFEWLRPPCSGCVFAIPPVARRRSARLSGASDTPSCGPSVLLSADCGVHADIAASRSAGRRRGRLQPFDVCFPLRHESADRNTVCFRRRARYSGASFIAGTRREKAGFSPALPAARSRKVRDMAPNRPRFLRQLRGRRREMRPGLSGRVETWRPCSTYPFPWCRNRGRSWLSSCPQACSHGRAPSISSGASCLAARSPQAFLSGARCSFSPRRLALRDGGPLRRLPS